MISRGGRQPSCIELIAAYIFDTTYYRSAAGGGGGTDAVSNIVAGSLLTACLGALTDGELGGTTGREVGEGFLEGSTV